MLSVNGKYVIWGASDNGKAIGMLMTELGYELVAYIDGNPDKWSEQVEGIRIFSPDDFNDILDLGIDTVIVGVSDKRVSDEIIRRIIDLINISGNTVKILDCNTVKNMIHEQYMKKMRWKSVFQWDVEFRSYATQWLKDIDSEVGYWLEVCAKSTGAAHEDYVKRVNNYSFTGVDSDAQEFACKLKEGDIVVDLGCGLFTMYGSELDWGKLQIIAMDPLAHFYNRINRKYASRKLKTEELCRFGMFEFVDSFLPQESVDCIIINNALDHCVDPYRSIIKCLHVIKKGGILRLSHRRAEAVFEGWQGLHKWNVDYNDEDELILWDRKNMVNVTKELDGVAEIILTHSPTGSLPEEMFVTVEIHKIRDINKGYDDYKSDRDELAYLLDCLMNKYANLALQ